MNYNLIFFTLLCVFSYNVNSQSRQAISDDVSLVCTCNLQRSFDGGNTHYSCTDKENELMYRIIIRNYSNYFDKAAIKSFNREYLDQSGDSFYSSKFLNSDIIEGVVKTEDVVINQMVFFPNPNYKNKSYSNITITIYSGSIITGNKYYQSLKRSIRYK